MTKFFLFHKEEVGYSSVTESDTGVGISIFAVPASSISHISASYGYVRVVFNDAGLYDFVDNNENESVQKTTVDISCFQGEESKLIEDILNFINVSSSSVMRFDFVSKDKGFRSVDPNGTVSVRIRTSPDELTPKSFSYEAKGATSSYSLIEGVTFAPNQYPIADYNTTGMSATTGGTGSSEGKIRTWVNSSVSGGTAYNLDTSEIITVYPEITEEVGREQTGLGATSAAFWSNGILLKSGNNIELDNDYTIYYVVGVPASRDTARETDLGDSWEVSIDRIGNLFSDLTNKVYGFSNDKEPSTFHVKDNNSTAGPAFVYTNNSDDGTVNYTFPDRSPLADRQTCYVFVIRRDSKYNLYMHNHEGSVVGYINANTDSSSNIGRTDGKMIISGLGFYGSACKVYVSRVGVITRDIGSSEASRIAQELYNKYKP